MPRTYQFNVVVALDTLDLKVNSVKRKFLNIIDHGTHFQLLVLIPNKEASTVAKVYSSRWVRPFGPPSVVINDQGTEFLTSFERLAQQNGSVHCVTGVESP